MAFSMTILWLPIAGIGLLLIGAVAEILARKPVAG